MNAPTNPKAGAHSQRVANRARAKREARQVAFRRLAVNAAPEPVDETPELSHARPDRTL